ncbi:MAG: hypothetical protein IKY87_01640 [Paludibacteraceae bacterium]|nr:hypothetical protein [Paludibacteraceae bacterium]
MKKIIIYLLPLLALISCDNSHTYDSFTVRSYDVHIGAADWQYTDAANNNYFYCVIDMPEITSSVFNNGEVNAYRVYNKNTNDAFKHILPDVLHCEDIVNDQVFLYTTTVDCIYGVGWLEFDYRASDFAYEVGNYMDFAPKSMDFTIVVTTRN